MPKQEEASPSKGLVGETRTAVNTSEISKQSDVPQQETKLGKTLAPSPSGQQLIGAALPVLSSTLPQQSPPARHLGGSHSPGALSLTTQSRAGSTISGQVEEGRRIGRDTSDSWGSGRRRASRDEIGSGRSSMMGSQSVGNFARKFYECCGCNKIFAAKEQKYFDLPGAKEQQIKWNKALVHTVLNHHKPLTLPKNLDHQIIRENGDKIFDSTKPLYVFAHADEERVKNKVEQLKGSEAVSSQPVAVTRIGGKTAIEIHQGRLYETRRIIFEVSIPPEEYIEAFSFMTHYAVKTGSKDNKGHKLDVVTLREPETGEIIQGLVGTDWSHCSTSDPESSTHADLYMKKGKKWAGVGAISNHTGIARDPNNERKLQRHAFRRP